MILHRFYDDYLAQASFLLGCEETRAAIVIDPNRDIAQYIAAAADARLKILAVAETHIHADFLSGTRELAQVLGVPAYLSDEGGVDWKYTVKSGLLARLLKDGDQIEVGSLMFEVLHTPGHTPEHVTFLVTDRSVSGTPIGAFTGDFIFAGEVGRPDLLEKTAGVTGTMRDSAAELYKSLQAFLSYPDHLQIWPGHGAGSACGKSLGAIPQTTLGYERLANWAFNTKSEAEFVARVLEGQPDPPLYFAQMKKMNRDGSPTTSEPVLLPELGDSQLQELAAAKHIIVDTRNADRYASGFLEGTLNIPLDKSFVKWAGSILPYDRDIYLIVDSPEENRLDEARKALHLIGLDRVIGYASSGALDRISAGGNPLSVRHRADVEDLKRANGLQILDVRTTAEWSEGHIAGSTQIALQSLASKLTSLDPMAPVAVHCAGGARSLIASSLLSAHGFRDVRNIQGGFGAWKKAGYPVGKA